MKSKRCVVFGCFSDINVAKLLLSRWSSTTVIERGRNFAAENNGENDGNRKNTANNASDDTVASIGRKLIIGRRCGRRCRPWSNRWNSSRAAVAGVDSGDNVGTAGGASEAN